MQLFIRSKDSYVLEFIGSESFSELKIRITKSERCDDALLSVAGRILDFEAEGLSDALQKCQNGKFRITPNGRKLFCAVRSKYRK
jgi:hypothetical protein